MQDALAAEASSRVGGLAAPNAPSASDPTPRVEPTLPMRLGRVVLVLFLIAVPLVVVPASNAAAEPQLAIAAGDQHSCALTAAGTVHCWGENGAGQAVDQIATTYTAIAAGGQHSCALTLAGTVHCWGGNGAGQAVDQVDTTYTAIAAGGQHSCALTTAGTVHCWGDNSSGQAVDQVDTTYTAIAAGGQHSCALTTAGTVRCWGENGAGQAVDQVDTTYTAIATGGQHSCAVTAADTVRCWGDNSSGQAPETVTPATVPGSPSQVVGTAGNGQVALSWVAPASDGGAAITDYLVSVYNGSGGVASGVTGATTRAVGSAATSYTFGGLTNGTSYTFKVAAVNAAGTGPQSPLSGAVPHRPPDAPTAVARTAGNGLVALSWIAPAADGGAAITDYQVSVYNGSGGVASGVTGATTRRVGSATTSYAFGGLANGTSYTFRVAAVNAAGTGPQSPLSGAVIAGSPLAPTAVQAVEAVAGSLRVSFTPGANNGSAITSFTATCTSTNGGTTRTASAASGPVTVTGLTTGKIYSCTVKATNARGAGLASLPSASVLLGAPSSVSATSADASAVVSWTAPPSSGNSATTGYDVTVAPGGRVVRVTDAAARSVSVGLLTNGTSYTFTVAARSANGLGPQSAPSAPVTPHVTAVIGNASVWEGTGFPVSASFAVSLREAAREPISVGYAVASGTATSGADFTALTGTVSFAVGDTSKFITVAVPGDTKVEPSETFTVTLSNPSNAVLGDAVGLGTIRDDDSWSGESIAVSDASVHEGDSGTRTVQLAIRAKVNAFPISIAYSVVRGSAAREIDALPPQTLELTGPNTLRAFTVKADVLKEGVEHFGIYISSPNVPVRDARGVVAIEDNDLTAQPASPLFASVTTADVWTPPSPLPPGTPGDVIWSIPTTGSTPAGATSSTMLYRSRSAVGDDVAISGWITVPNGTAPAGGWPVLAWGHWTLGMDDSCAPTRRFTPSTVDPYIGNFIAARYVVVAPDYEGLGTPGAAPYWAAESYAHAMLDSIRAVRKLVPNASNQAVVFGGSEGGIAATAAAELWPYYAPEIDLRGAVGSGAGVATSFAQVIATRNAGGFVGNSLAMVAGQNNAYPNAGILGYFLTSAGIQTLGAVQSVCSDQYASYSGTTGLFKPWLADDPLMPPPMTPALATATDWDTLGSRAPAAPVFYVHGRSDANFPPALIPPFVKRLCDLGTTVKLSWYNEGHMPFTTSRTDVLAWIAARFSGSAPPTSCANIPHAESVAPTVSFIARAAASPTNASSVTWTVRFSENVTGVGAANFSLASTGPSGAAISGVTGTGKTRTVTASTGTGDGDLRLNLSNVSGIIDAAANPLSAPFTGTAYAIDKTAPTVVSITRADASPTNAAEVAWTVTFDEPVTGTAIPNFSLSGDGASTASISNLTGSGTTFSVSATTGATGALELDLTDPTGVRDIAGNGLSNAFSGEAYLIEN